MGRLSRWVPCNHKVFIKRKREAGGSGSEGHLEMQYCGIEDGGRNDLRNAGGL